MILNIWTVLSGVACIIVASLPPHDHVMNPYLYVWGGLMIGIGLWTGVRK